MFAVFSPPETHTPIKESEFENELVRELQSVFGFKKTRTLPYRPQGNSVLERVHSTMHNMLATLANASCDNWVELLPFVQLAHNTAYIKTLHETPLITRQFKRVHENCCHATSRYHSRRSHSYNTSQSRQDYSRRTVENLQVAYEIARRNLQERAEKQAKSNENITFPSFQPGDPSAIHRPYTPADGPCCTLGDPPLHRGTPPPALRGPPPLHRETPPLCPYTARSPPLHRVIPPPPPARSPPLHRGILYTVVLFSSLYIAKIVFISYFFGSNQLDS